MITSQMFSIWFLLKLTDLGDAIFCNVAYRRQTNQSSAYYETHMLNGNPCNAVDGLNDQNFFTKSCIHTKLETSPWWQVDMGDIYSVEFINISVRTDNTGLDHYKKISQIEINLSSLLDGNLDLDSPALCATYTLVPALTEIYNPITIYCSSPTTGRYLRVTRKITTADTLQFCEAEVYANLSTCPDPPDSWTCRDLCYDKTTKTNVCPAIDTTTETSVSSFVTTGSSGNSAIVTSLDCSCPCTSVGIYAYQNITDEELQKKIAELIDAIKIDTKKTSLAKSKLTSAKDDRPSAKAVGSLGIIMLVLTFGIICAMDFNFYINGIKFIKKIFIKGKDVILRK